MYIPAENPLLSKNDKKDVHVLLDSSDELKESFSERFDEQNKIMESESIGQSKEVEPNAVVPKAVENAPSASQYDAASECNGIEQNDKKIEAMDGVQESVDVFELMKENEHLFDSTDKSSNGPVERGMQKMDTVQTSTQNIKENDNDSSVQRKECINVDCLNSSNMFYDAPDFVINHFHLKKHHKQMFVCDICFDECIQKYGIEISLNYCQTNNFK